MNNKSDSSKLTMTRQLCLFVVVMINSNSADSPPVSVATVGSRTVDVSSEV